MATDATDDEVKQLNDDFVAKLSERFKTLHAAFLKVDRNRSGCIDKAELVRMIKSGSARMRISRPDDLMTSAAARRCHAPATLHALRRNRLFAQRCARS